MPHRRRTARFLILACLLGAASVGCVSRNPTPPPLPTPGHRGSAAGYTARSEASAVAFTITHRRRPLAGRFTAVSGSFTPPTGPDQPGWLYAAVAAGSIDTQNRLRDAHLRTADYFDAARHPAVTFESRDVTPLAGTDTLRARGTLTLLGVARPLAVTLHPATNPAGGPAHTCTFTIERSDFGFTAGLNQGLGDRVELQVSLAWNPGRAHP